MDWVKLFETIFKSHSIKDWDVSVNGVRKGPVVDGKVGLKNVDTFWALFVFEVNGKTCTLDGERPLAGGLSTIYLDRHLIANSHLSLHKHITGFPPHLRLSVVFDLHDGRTFRFDGTVL